MFEDLEVEVTINGTEITILILYRAEPSKKNNYSMADFFSELNNWISCIIIGIMMS